jgi:hypothetical protein
VTPPPNAAGWNNTPVTVTWSVGDPESGIVTSSCPPVTVSAETDGIGVTCSAANGAGRRVERQVMVRLDRTPPFITAAPSPAANTWGWNNTDVVVTFAAADALSGLASVSTPITVTQEGAGQVASGVAIDRAGNSATAAAAVNLDKTAPRAVLRFDVFRRDLLVVGRDALSGVPPGDPAMSATWVRWGDGPAYSDCEEEPDTPAGRRSRAQRRTYLLADRAGNRLVLVAVVKDENRGLQARVESVSAGGHPRTWAGPNRIRLRWSFAKKGKWGPEQLVLVKQFASVGRGHDRESVEVRWTLAAGALVRLRLAGVRPQAFRSNDPQVVEMHAGDGSLSPRIAAWPER